MSNSFSNIISFSLPGLPSVGWPWSKAASIEIPKVHIYDIDTDHDRRARALKHLVRLNHANHSVLYHHLNFHNHCNHILGSAYILGGSAEHLNDIYESEAKELEPWKDSPDEISLEDWREFLGKKEYQRAFVDFFEDQLVQSNYDWHALLNKFLFEGKEPLINNLICGLGHPLIHLGYAYELSSRTLAIEALTMATCCYNFMHKYLDDPSYTEPPSNPTADPLEILSRVAKDSRFDGLFDHQGQLELEALFGKPEIEAAMLEHWNSWSLTNPCKAFELSQRTAAALVVCTEKADGKYDFFLVHLLTTSHAVRILLPLMPVKWQIPLVRQWWLFVLTVYVMQLRPKIDVSKIPDSSDPYKRGWNQIKKAAIEGPHKMDAHFVKACRAMEQAAECWGDADHFYLKMALTFIDEFDGWGGFGEASTSNWIHEIRKR